MNNRDRLGIVLIVIGFYGMEMEIFSYFVTGLFVGCGLGILLGNIWISRHG